MPSFTIQIPDLRTRGPLVEMRIGMGEKDAGTMTAQGRPPPAPIAVTAMIDTGATHTCLQAGLAQRLGLCSLGQVPMRTTTSVGVPCHVYAIQMLFPNNVLAEGKAVEAPLNDHHIQVLIGRDILSRATLVYIGSQNLFHLSF